MFVDLSISEILYAECKFRMICFVSSRIRLFSSWGQYCSW